MDNPYVVLGVSENATPEVVKIAFEGKFKALAKAGLADKGRKAEAEQLKRAYQVLSDPRKRATYDKLAAGALERAEGRSRARKRAVVAAVVVALALGLGWYFRQRSQRLESVRQQEGQLARDAEAKKKGEAAEHKRRARVRVEDEAAKFAAEKQAEAERVRMAREQHKHAVEQARAKAAAEAKAQEERYIREQQERSRKR